jgi:hypothetical protein
MHTPPFAPPKGTFTIAHLKVMSAARAMTSSRDTSTLKRMPPLVGSRWWLCSARKPWTTSISPWSSRTGKCISYTALQRFT